MVGKVLFVVCVLSTLSLVQPTSLTREINLGQFPQSIISDLGDQIRSINIRSEIVKLIFKNPDELFSTLAALLNAKSNPDVSEVLDIFNYNLGGRLLVVNDGYIQVDSRAYRTVASGQARDLVQTIFPRNFLQQLVIYGLVETQLQRASQIVIDQRKVPVEQMTALIVPDGHMVVKRDALSELFSSLLITVCNELLSAAYSQLNSTLTRAYEYLDGIDVSSSSSESLLVQVGANLTSLVIDVGKELITGVNTIAEAVTESICNDLFSSSTSSSRKRRDVADFDVMLRNNTLAEVLTRDVAWANVLSGYLDIIWYLVSGELETVFTLLVNSTISVVKSNVDNFLDGSFTTWALSIVKAIFS